MNNLIALSLNMDIVGGPDPEIIFLPVWPAWVLLLIRLLLFVLVLFVFTRKKIRLAKKIFLYVILVILFALTFFVEYALYNDYFSIKLIQSLL